MLRIGNTAMDFEGNPINYWGKLVVPLALSLWPAWALLLSGPSPRATRSERTANETHR